MPSREDVYAKYGITAEAAQLFETELGTLLFGANAAANAWHVEPDVDAGRKLLEEIDSHTLGRLLSRIKGIVGLSDDLQGTFSSALKARNRLTHGFFERHSFGIQTDAGLAKMMAELEQLHAELFNAWQLAGALTSMMMAHLLAKRDGGVARIKRELSELRRSKVPTSPVKQASREAQINVLKQALAILGDEREEQA